ncbi:MAG: hypothetical protein ABSA47_13860 [Verrucomicrobiota bacterium]|jgi:hypothetical protein
MTPQNDKALLRRLLAQNVEFVVIGGVCGILHGAELVTFDLDICCRFSRENLRRIETAVKDLNPHHRLTANKLPLELTDELCDRLKNIYLTTDLGILDCLGEVSGLGDYEQVLRRSITQQMSYGKLQILSLDALIVAKEAAGREKDLYATRLLRAIKPQN